MADVGMWQAAMEPVALQAKDAREPLSAKGRVQEIACVTPHLLLGLVQQWLAEGQGLPQWLHLLSPGTEQS